MNEFDSKIGENVDVIVLTNFYEFSGKSNN